MTLLDYAKQQDEDDDKKYDSDNNFEEWLIAKRREKENDNAKMFDTVNNYLSLQKQSTDFKGPLKSQVSSPQNTNVKD